MRSLLLSRAWYQGGRETGAASGTLWIRTLCARCHGRGRAGRGRVRPGRYQRYFGGSRPANRDHEAGAAQPPPRCGQGCDVMPRRSSAGKGPRPPPRRAA